MATVGDVIAALEKFELDLVDKKWSDDIWENDFTTSPDELPDEFEDKFSPLKYSNIVQVIEEADKMIHMWLNENLNTNVNLNVNVSLHSDSESTSSCNSVMGISWTSLQEVNYKKLLAVLYFYICKGQINNQDANAVQICVKATNFYYTLLMIPGSNIYKVFNMSLFERCLETFSLHKYLEIATGRKVKKAKPKKGGGFSSEEEFLDIDETLTLSQQQNVVKQLNILLSNFQQLVNKFHFKKYPEAVSMSLNHLAELTRLERTSNLQEFCNNNNNNSFAPLSRNAYLTMKDFCNSRHGRISENIRLVLYYIMPNLTSIGGSAVPELNKFNQKELSNIRSVAVSFVTDNIIPLGDAATLGLKILIQQICFNMIDRADYRSKATDMILTILSKLSMNLYYTLVTWIFRLSMMEGAHHRVIGIELLSRLLYMKPGTTELSVMTNSQMRYSQLGVSQHYLSKNNDFEVSKGETTEKSDFASSITQAALVSFSHPINHVPIEYRRAMLAIIIDRIRDEAAIVRTRALAVIGELLSNKTSPTVKSLLEEIFISPYLDKNVIDTENTEENGFLKWKTFVASLDKVRERKANKAMIPGAIAIVNKIFEKCMDDRVNVRKAALQVIMKIFMFSSKWMTDKNLQLFGRHCRDPALSIRKDMVSCVTELMLFFPDHEELTKLWVKEVVPQITDRELRVQEQVLQVFTNVILSKIVVFEKTKTTTDELPWKLLDCIARQKMRSFLVTACSLWKKSGQISQNLIKTIKTHIGTVNDGPAWILMSAISEYVDIESPQFVLSYYFSRISKNTGDLGVLNLALLTLNNCWNKLNKASLESLEKDLYKNIEMYSVPSTLMRYSVEIATSITVMTAADEPTGKQEVAKWSAEMIEKAESHLIRCLKNKNSNDAKCNKCVTVLSLLGNLCDIRWDKISNSLFYMLHEFLINSWKEDDTYYRQMTAITIITLSKMALRNDYFARSLVSSLSDLLSSSKDSVILNNVIVAIADIGERYANLIEPLISSVCVCLKSNQKVVKEISLILLIELLQEDYLKARGALVFHLLTLVNDSDPIAINIVKYYFTNCLIARHPYKMYELLLPSLFHYNQYTRHPDYPALEMAESERIAFDLSGKDNHRKRMNIYQFMLSNIPDMVRMKCLHFICTVVLNGAADNIISLKSGKGEQVVLDALSVLLTKEIKLEYNELVKKNNEDGEEDDEQKQNPLYKLGKQIFSAAQKKEIIETIIPICCKLKKKLQQENTKLLPYLHKFVRELVQDYKDEIGEIFKDDKQFGIEILHEIEKMASNETVEEEDEEQEEVAPSVGEDNGEVIPAIMNASREEGENIADTATMQLVNEAPDVASKTTVAQEYELKDAVVCIERLSQKECGLLEEDQRDEVKKAVEDIANQEEALKRLSITLERLSSKYLKFLESGKTSLNEVRNKETSEISANIHEDPKLRSARVSLERLSYETITNSSSHAFEDIEEAVKKAAAKVVMPQPMKGGSRKGRRTALTQKKRTPRTPEQKKTQKNLVTSTPMLHGDGHVFPDISPVVDDSDVSENEVE